MPEHERPMYHIMTDEEFQEYHRKLRKKNLLDEMMAASKSKSFSAKSARQSMSMSEDQPTTDTNIKQFKPASEQQSSFSHISDEEWGDLLANVMNNDMSPIKKVTDANMTGFSLEDVNFDATSERDTYKYMYKEEQAMLAEILKDATKQSEIANNIIKQMTNNGKQVKLSGGYGLSKTFPDLLSAANSLNQTRRSIIKDMADLKKSAADFDLKRAKEMNDASGESVNDTANAFFGQIVGNRKQFIESAMASAMGSMPLSQYNEQSIDESFPTPNNSTPANGGAPAMNFNITAPLDGYGEDDIDYEDADPYGYLRNEGRDVSICVQTYSDGSKEFVAMDSDGNYVEDYELPDSELLEDMSVRPTSNYVTDAEGRRYKVIRFTQYADEE